jgi:uncharacterized protein with NRDE domain
LCTVAILPAGEDGYVLGHNRDESLQRPRGEPPARETSHGRAVLAPRDPAGGGTWIGVNDAGITLCILNASHADPGRLPREPLSRGQVLRGILHLDSQAAVADQLAAGAVDLGSTRAFHLVMVSPGGKGMSPGAERFLWNGVRLERDGRDLPALFVSSGYDQAGAEASRGACWRSWLRRRERPDEGSLADWLAGHEPESGVLSVCMHGARAGTVSRTLVSVEAASIRVRYHDGPPCHARAPDRTVQMKRKTVWPAPGR